MTRVHVFVEGQTEETFVQALLCECLQRNSVYLNPILVRTSATSKGGVVRYAQIKPQLNRKCLEDPGSFVTTMFDLFRLPGDFPGQDSLPNTSDPFQKAQYLEDQMRLDMGHANFLPNLLIHEFEGLLFSDPEKFASWFDDKAVQQLRKERSLSPSPEHINDGPTTAPSKRISRHCPTYQKPWHGSLIALDIGLDTIRQQCRHFDAWLKSLAELGGEHLP